MQEMVNERVRSFIRSMQPGESSICMAIEQEAREAGVPIIREEMKSFIKVLLAMNQPKNILEIGTAVGYSAILMSEQLSEDGHITTIENYPVRIPLAKANFARAGKEDRITLLEGDAGQLLKELEGPYDFIFLDAAKAQYIVILPELVRLLKKGGVLLTDNVLQEGDIIESRYGVTRRNRTIYDRMREYLYAVMHHDELESTIVPIGDGVAISVRK